jgi:hypothetical protein
MQTRSAPGINFQAGIRTETSNTSLRKGYRATPAPNASSHPTGNEIAALPAFIANVAIWIPKTDISSQEPASTPMNDLFRSAAMPSKIARTLGFIVNTLALSLPIGKSLRDLFDLAVETL